MTMFMTDFLREVDRLAVAMSKDQLIGFIHNEARLLNESQREEFLANLKAFSALPAKAKKDSQTVQAPDNISVQLSAVYKGLDSISKGEAYLIAEWNEEYDEWHNAEAEVYIYHDPEHIADTITSACHLLHTLIDWEKYDEVTHLAKTLLELEITVENEYDEDESFSFGDLFEHGLVSADYEKIVLDMLLAAYMSLPLPERAATIYHFIELSKCRHINIEKLMQYSARELPHMPEFLDAWIELLCGQSGRLTEKLLRESVTLITDNEKLVRCAEKYGVTHPCIYDALLEKDSFADTKEAVQVGMRALAIIPMQYTVRSSIALMTAKYALASNDPNHAEYCWLEAFRSRPTAVNLLRLMTLHSHFADIEQEVRTIIHQSIKTDNPPSCYEYNKAQELLSYHISRTDQSMLLFLLGDYQDILEKDMQPLESLGWSYTFLKRGIPLFFLLMYNNTHLDKAMMKMCETVSEYMSFNAKDYCYGTQFEGDDSSEAWFWHLFVKIRNPDKLTEEEQEAIIDRLTDLTELRTNLIVSGQKRGYYDECAAYIAALGEVLESRGKNGSKQTLLSKYQSRYPRHSAFIRELKSFGLK